MQNLELKFRCDDLATAAARTRMLGAIDRGVLYQHDLFFPVPLARLKLRVFPEGPAELISYRRADSSTARTSEYLITRIDDPQSLIATLTHALGQPRSLKKTRHLFLYRATRIHVDTVEGLGTFVELETVMTTQTLADATAELQHVVAALELTDPVPTAYVDLLPVSPANCA